MCCRSSSRGQHHDTTLDVARISFANLTQNGWGQTFDFDRATARSIEFEMENVISFDIALDDVAFYTEEAP